MGKFQKIYHVIQDHKKRGIAKQPQGKEKQNDKSSNEFT
jgi:hypothetical protein